jgi:protein involved in polysaccharide export with SLBB domain
MKYLVFAAIAALGASPVVARAQDLPPIPSGLSQAKIEKALSNPNIADRIRQQIQASGMTADQIRSRLTAAGYSSDLLDAYLPSTGASTGEVQPTQDVYGALSALGVGPTPVQGLEAVRVDSGVSKATVEKEGKGLQLFGTEVFRGRSTQFQPLLSGPVPDSYRVGPGDVMVLVLTGDVEAAYTLEITREGFIVIPQVGQLFLSGLTMTQLQQTFKDRLSKSYSGVRAGTTRFDITIARLRTNQVFVTGEVMQPGAYQLASVATVLNALYAAGGPNDRGDFRNVEVRRQGKVISTMDLYNYLLRGETTNDIILEQGDLVFIPEYSARVTLAGAAVRPAVYQLRAGQTLSDLIDLGGGFRPNAQLNRLTIHRLLPAAERGPGRPPRVAIDVELVAAGANGQVAREARLDTKAGSPDGHRGMVIPAMTLEDGDSVAVDEVLPLDESYFVTVSGMIQRPGKYPWRQGMKLKDLVFLARGPKVGADLREGEIARLPADRSTGQLATTIRVPLDSSFLTERDLQGRYAGAAGVTFPAAGTAPEVTLEPFDNVLLLRQPQFELQRSVEILGEVPYPGTYSLTKKDERLSDLIKRAGGLLPTAYQEGSRLVRPFDHAGRVNIELRTVLEHPGGPQDIVLQPGDSVTVPEYNPTVRVEGGVNTPTSVLYQKGKDLEYYISNAGGFSRTADKGRVSVRYANGAASTRSKFLFWTSSPEPMPGSVVVVPTKPDEKNDVRGLVADITQILATLATLMVVALKS